MLSVRNINGVFYATFSSPRALPIDKTRLCPTESESTFVCHHKAVDGIAIRTDRLSEEERKMCRIYPQNHPLRILLTSRDSVSPRHRYILRTALNDAKKFYDVLEIRRGKLQLKFQSFDLPENWHNFSDADLMAHLCILQQIQEGNIIGQILLDEHVSLGMDSYTAREKFKGANFIQRDPVTKQLYYPKTITMQHIRDAQLLTPFVQSLLERLRGDQFIRLLSIIREPDIHAELFHELHQSGSSFHDLVDVLPPPREEEGDQSPEPSEAALK
jgi:hypothetical protein